MWIEKVINGMIFMKNFWFVMVEEWYVFFLGYEDLRIGGVVGKVMIYYNFYGNRDVFINIIVILDDLVLFKGEIYFFVYVIVDEFVNRLVGYVDILFFVYVGENLFDVEYK